MVEQHINPAGTTSDNQFFLSANESESCSELKQETGDILFQRCFKLLLLIVCRDSYKTEIIVVLCDFLCHTALCLRQILREITDSVSVCLV